MPNKAKAIYNFKNTKEKLCMTNAAIWYTWRTRWTHCLSLLIPEDGNLELKYVGAGTWYEMCFIICFIVF